MLSRKDLIIVALATFCLTASLFMILPTKSNPGLGEYDAWNDLNEDGQIDIFDAIQFAGTFNTAHARAKHLHRPINTAETKDNNPLSFCLKSEGEPGARERWIACAAEK